MDNQYILTYGDVAMKKVTPNYTPMDRVQKAYVQKRIEARFKGNVFGEEDLELKGLGMMTEEEICLTFLRLQEGFEKAVAALSEALNVPTHAA